MTYDQALAHLALLGWGYFKGPAWAGVYKDRRIVWSYDNDPTAVKDAPWVYTGKPSQVLVPAVTAVHYIEYITQKGL